MGTKDVPMHMVQGVEIRIGRFPVQILLGARPGLGIQPRYEVPGDLGWNM